MVWKHKNAFRKSNEDQGDEDEPQNIASTIEDKVDFYKGVLLWYKEKKKLVKIVRTLMS